MLGHTTDSDAAPIGLGPRRSGRGGPRKARPRDFRTVGTRARPELGLRRFPKRRFGGRLDRSQSRLPLRRTSRNPPPPVQSQESRCSLLPIGVLWPARLDSLGPILQPSRNDFRSTGSTRSPFRQPRPVDWQRECCQGKNGRLGHWSRVRDGSHTFRKRRKASARQRPENAVRARLRIRSAGSPAFLIILVGPGQYAAAGIKGIRGKV